MSHDFRPALIIGAGGTGVKSLRFIKSMGQSNPDSALAQRLENGSIKLIGIDTDAKSNEPGLQIDPNLVGNQDTKGSEADAVPLVLSPLESFIPINADLARTLNMLQHYQPIGMDGKSDTPDDDIPLQSIASWFPKRNQVNGDEITFGQSKVAGAAQWRPLGRMALFLKSQRIYDVLRKTFLELQEKDSDGRVLVYIVCSLAGGTGSGMFWDLSFMIQLIDASRTTSIGMFLLGDPFEGVKASERIYPNTYAALKELAIFKNWREPLKVKYNFGEDFSGRPTGPSPFDMVYLYQAFPCGDDVADKVKSTIDVSCFRIAQNLLAHLRSDLFAELDVSKNNLNGDTAAKLSSPLSTYCFSTSGTTSFKLRKIDKFEVRFQNLLIESLRPKAPDETELIEPDVLVKELGFHSADAFRNISRTLEQSLFEELRDRKAPCVTKLQTAVSLALDSYRTDSKEDPGVSMRKCFPPSFLEALETDGSEIKIGTLQEDFEPQIRKRVDEVLASVEAGIKRIKATRLCLDENSKATIRNLIGGLDHTKTASMADVALTIKRPPQYDQIKVHLAGKQLNFLQSLAFKASFSNTIIVNIYENMLKNIGNQLDEMIGLQEGQIKAAVARVWNSSKSRIREELQGLLEDNQNLRNELEAKRRLVADVESLFKKAPESNIKPETIQDFLKSLIPEEKQPGDFDNWLNVVSHDLFLKIKRYEHNEQTAKWTQPLPQTELKENMSKLLQNIKSDMETTGIISEEHLASFVKCIVVEPPLDDKSEAEHFVFHAKCIMKLVIDFFNFMSNSLLQKIGGGKFLRERLLRCRSRIFASNLIENRLNTSNLVILPFSPDADYTDDERATLKGIISTVSENVMDTTPLISNRYTEEPIIYYEDLFRSPEEIHKIRDYYHAYTKVHAQSRHFYHITAEVAAFPEIVGEVIEVNPVWCGNPGCSTNINRLPRTEAICPGCRNPIWNRCGNKSCTADNVWETIQERYNYQGDPSMWIDPPDKCPVCNRKMTNYWWECNTHTRVPAYKEACPDCISEVQRNARTVNDIERRPDIRSLECPGCMKMGKAETERIKIPAPLIRFFHDGVSDPAMFENVLTSMSRTFDLTIINNECPNGPETHMFFPTCPVDRHNPEQRHFLVRGTNGQFYCPKKHHSELTFLECYCCKYPIDDSDLEKGKCPRCLNHIFDCQYCSHITNRVYPINQNSAIPAQCPNCRNLMESLDTTEQLSSYLQTLETPAFCPNIYRCNASRDLWKTATEFNLIECQICNSPKKSQVSPSLLLELAELHELIDSCPLCLATIGKPDENGRINTYTGKTIAHLFARSLLESTETLDEDCPICGTIHSSILRWMLESNWLDTGTQENTEQTGDISQTSLQEDLSIIQSILDKTPSRPIPRIDFLMALDIFIIFTKDDSPSTSFSKLKEAWGLWKTRKLDSSNINSIHCVFQPNSLSTQKFKERLDEIWTHHNRYMIRHGKVNPNKAKSHYLRPKRRKP